MAISSSKRKQDADLTNAKKVIKKKLDGSNHIDSRVVVDIDTAIIKTKRYIDGSDWEVTYYNLLVANHDMIGKIDTSIGNVEQQYTKISKLVLKVTSPIESTKLQDITGEATILDFTPSIGDAFVGTLIGDIKAVFNVTAVTEKSYNLDRVFDIEFKLEGTITTNPDLFGILDKRSVREYIYDKNAIYTTSDTLLLKSDYLFKDYITEKFTTTSKHYADTFTDSSTRNMLILNHNGSGYHDSVIAYLFNNIADKQFKTKFVESDCHKNTIVDILLEDTKEYLSTAKQPGYGSTKNTYGYGYRYRSIIGLPVSNIIDEKGNIHIQNESDALYVGFRETYLFSKEFYSQGDNLPLLEELLLDILLGKQLEQSKVSTLLDKSFKFNNQEKYHYIPFVLLVLKYTMNTMHSKG